MRLGTMIQPTFAHALYGNVVELDKTCHLSGAIADWQPGDLGLLVGKHHKAKAILVLVKEQMGWTFASRVKRA